MINWIDNRKLSVFSAALFLFTSFGIAETVLQNTYNRESKNRAGIKKSDLMIRILNNSSGKTAKEKAWKHWRASRLEWTYANDPAFLKLVHDSGGTYAGAMASGTNNPNYALVAFDGQKVSAHNRYRGCMNNPGFTFEQYSTAVNWANLGTDSIQHDEALTNFTSFHYGWATCFCEFCMKDFAKYCQGREISCPPGVKTWEGFDYGQFLRESQGIESNSEYERKRKSLPLSREFEWFQASVGREYKNGLLDLWKAKTGERLILSMNMVPEMAGTFGFSRCPILDYIDYIIGEYYVDKKTAEQWVHCCRFADAMNLEFIASIKKVAKTPTVDETRQAIALSYALGHHVLLPWDIYIHDAPRWYGDIKDYEDIVSFIDDNPDLFDGYKSYFDIKILVPFEKEEYEPGLVALAGQLQDYGVLFSYSLCGSDRNGFVDIPINPEDFDRNVPVWHAGNVEDFEKTDWTLFKKLAEHGEIDYKGQILPKLFANKQKVKTQVQAMHDKNLNEPEQQSSSDESVKEAMLEKSARMAAELMINSGLKPAYRVFSKEEILVLPRVKEDGDRPVVFHIVCTSDQYRDETVIWLDKKFFTKSNELTAQLHQPGSKAVSLKPAVDKDGLLLKIPNLKKWAILTFDKHKN